jgi:predicted RNA-binding Zn ribbon-like protein
MVTDRAADTDLAPGPLRLVQSLANTRTESADLLETRDQAVSWLRAAGVLPDDAVITGSEHGALQRLRDALRDMLAAHAGGMADTDAAARLTRGLADGRLVVTVDQASMIGLASGARAPYSSVVAAFAAAVAESAAAKTWRQLKTCTAAGCGTAFYDGSPDTSLRRCAAHAG